jgi:hypothetical protein
MRICLERLFRGIVLSYHIFLLEITSLNTWLKTLDNLTGSQQAHENGLGHSETHVEYSE